MAPARSTSGLTPRLCQALVVALAAAACPAQRASAEATLVKAQLVLEAAPAGGAVTLSLHVDFDRRGGFGAAAVVTQNSRGQVTQVHGGVLASFGDPVTPTAHHAGATTGCVAGWTCHFVHQAGSGVVFVATGGNAPGPGNRIHIAAEGTAVDVRVTGPGWRLIRVPADFVAVPAAAADGTGLALAGRGVELFGRASAPAPAPVTIALGQPPCSYSVAGAVSRGVGTVQLRGGPRRPSATCPWDVGPLVDAAEGATTWELEGLVAGERSLAGVRLLVLGVRSGRRR